MPAVTTPCVLVCLMLWATSALCADTAHRLPLTITSDLPLPNVPMDPSIDFGRLIAEAGIPGRLDPNSIQVVNTTTGETVPHALSHEFAHGDKGRVRWVVRNPAHRHYEIRFHTAPTRPPLKPATRTPLIGVGDLLRYNAGEPRPIVLPYLSRLVDLTGDGKRDMVGCWNYAYELGQPWDGIFCYPRVGRTDQFLFGDPIRLRYVDKPGSRNFKHFTRTYMHADVVDLNGDGLIDVVYSPQGGDKIYLFLNSGERDDGGLPVFVACGSLPRGTKAWAPCRAVDLNNDGAMDFVVGNTYLRNTNPKGWPIKLAAPVKLDVGRDACFCDVDCDGLLDAVCLIDGPEDEPRARRAAWRKNLGGDPPKLGPPEPIEDIDCWWCDCLAAVNDGERKGLLILHNVRQNVSFYERVQSDGGRPKFRRFGRAESLSAVMSLSDQAWPCVCDWNDDGAPDLLVGGGYGWPRILINAGTREQPAFAEAQPILAGGKPIRILRNEILGGKHWHNMGYPYPVFVDWDGDGLPDLMLPNETNRIFWYKNVGAPGQPKFVKRRQLMCDGYPDSPAKRAKSAKLAADKNTPNQPYPYEEDRPFFWRTGVGFADLNGDGLMDLITHDGHTRKLTLFAQYRDAKGKLRLRKHGPLRLADGRPIDDSIVGRSKHWTESFRCVDWDGDGLIDIIYSCAGSHPAKGSIDLLRNCGTKTEPVFEAPAALRCFGRPIYVSAHGPHPWVGDLAGDGRPDVLTCVEWSAYPFFSHAAIEMKERPSFEVHGLR